MLDTPEEVCIACSSATEPDALKFCHSLAQHHIYRDYESFRISSRSIVRASSMDFA